MLSVTKQEISIKLATNVGFLFLKWPWLGKHWYGLTILFFMLCVCIEVFCVCNFIYYVQRVEFKHYFWGLVLYKCNLLLWLCLFFYVNHWTWSDKNLLCENIFQLNLSDATMTLKYDEGHQSWVQSVKLNGGHHHDKFERFHLRNI